MEGGGGGGVICNRILVRAFFDHLVCLPLLRLVCFHISAFCSCKLHTRPMWPIFTIHRAVRVVSFGRVVITQGSVLFCFRCSTILVLCCNYCRLFCIFQVQISPMFGTQSCKITKLTSYSFWYWRLSGCSSWWLSLSVSFSLVRFLVCRFPVCSSVHSTECCVTFRTTATLRAVLWLHVDFSTSLVNQRCNSFLPPSTNWQVVSHLIWRDDAGSTTNQTGFVIASCVKVLFKNCAWCMKVDWNYTMQLEKA